MQQNVNTFCHYNEKKILKGIKSINDLDIIL